EAAIDVRAVFAEGVVDLDGDLRAGVKLADGEHAEAREIDDLLEAEVEVRVDVEAGADNPARDAAPVARDERVDVLVGQLAKGLVVVLPDVEPVGDAAGGEVHDGAGDDGELAAFDGPLDPAIGGGEVLSALFALQLAPGHGAGDEVEAAGEDAVQRVGELLVVDDAAEEGGLRFRGAGARKGKLLLDALEAHGEIALGLEQGETFGGFDAELEGPAGEGGLLG